MKRVAQVLAFVVLQAAAPSVHACSQGMTRCQGGILWVCVCRTADNCYYENGGQCQRSKKRSLLKFPRAFEASRLATNGDRAHEQ